MRAGLGTEGTYAPGAPTSLAMAAARRSIWGPSGIRTKTYAKVTRPGGA